MLETKRLILRRWADSDAENLYEYAKDPDVGPIAGWPPHQSIDESRDVIRNVFNGKEAYAICLKKDGKAIGAIELKLNGHTDMTDRDDECELGYWLGKPYWGRGIMPEAVKEILRHAFDEIGMTKVWAGYYEGNTKSKRVQEKSGFRYQWKSEGVDVPLMHEKRTGHVSSMTKDQWIFDSVHKGNGDKNSSMMKLKKLPYSLTVCKVEDISAVTLSTEFFFIGRTDEELSLVCRTEDVPVNTIERDDGWRGFRIEGVLDFSLIGILSRLSTILAENRIGIFAISTFNTDYILVKEDNFERAMNVLVAAGNEVTE